MVDRPATGQASSCLFLQVDTNLPWFCYFSDLFLPFMPEQPVEPMRGRLPLWGYASYPTNRPGALIIQRQQEEVGLVELFQHGLAIALAGHGIAERAIQAFEDRGLQQEGAHANRARQALGAPLVLPGKPAGTPPRLD